MHKGVRVTSGDGYVVAELFGDLDLGSVDPIRDELRQLAEGMSGTYICDLTDVTFIDSSAISLLVGLHRIVQANGGNFVVVNVAPSVGRPLQLTKVDTAFHVYPAEPRNRPTSAACTPGM